MRRRLVRIGQWWRRNVRPSEFILGVMLLTAIVRGEVVNNAAHDARDAAKDARTSATTGTKILQEAIDQSRSSDNPAQDPAQVKALFDNAKEAKENAESARQILENLNEYIRRKL